MTKFTQTQIKQFVANDIAINVTDWSSDKLKWLKRTCHLETVGRSVGVYGTNGILLYDRENRQFYAVTARCSNGAILF